MKMKLTVIALFLFPLFAKAQSFRIDKRPLPLDSLKKVLPSLHDSARVDCLIEVTRSWMEAATPIQFDSALSLARQAYTEAYAIKYIKGLGDVCVLYGEIYSWYDTYIPEVQKYYREAIFWHEKIQNDNGLGFALRGLGCGFLWQGSQDSLDKAMKAFEQSASHFRKTGNQVMLADLLDWVGYVYQFKGNLEKHFEYIKKGLREKKRINDNRGLVWSYHRLAHIYQSVEDFETSLNYFRQSIRQAHSQSIRFKNIYSAIGKQFLYMKNYDSSIYYFQEALQILPTDGESLMGLGKLYMERKEYSKALNYLQKALISLKKGNDIGLIIWVLVDMGKSYAGLKQYAKALQSGRECLAMARLWVMKDPMWHAYKTHWNVYEALQQKDSAYFYFSKFITLRDSLNDARSKLQHLQKLALYKAETKEEQQQARIELLNKDNQIKHQQLREETLMKKIFAGSLAALILLGIIIFRNIALKRRNEKHRRELAENELEIQKLETQKQLAELEMQALRAQMNPHFIFNSLNSINGFIFKNQRTEATDYLTKFSRLIRMILHSSASAAVSLTEELAALQLYIELESLRFENKFDFKIECDPDLDTDFIHVPPMLLQPYVENAIWHGLMLKKDKGNLWVNICQDKSLLICTVTDNGIGRAKAAELKNMSVNEHKSMGMSITAARIALLHQKNQMKTDIQITDLVFPDGSPGGTEVVIKIPVAYD